MPNDENANDEIASLFSQIFSRKNILAAFGLIITTIGGYLLTQTKAEINFRDPNTYKFILSLFNLLAAGIFYAFSESSPELEFAEDPNARSHKKDVAKQSYWEKLNVKLVGGKVDVEGKKVDPIRQAGINEDRVNKLVRQLHDNINLFALFLIFVYSLFLLDNQPLLAQLGIDKDKYNWLHPILKAGEDIFNFWSAVFIYLAFRVLYDKTLNKKNKDNGYRRGPILFASILTVGYLFFVIMIYPQLTYYKTASLKEISKTLKQTENQSDEKKAEEIKNIKALTFRYDSNSDGTLSLKQILDIKETNEAPGETIKKIEHNIENYRHNIKWLEILANLIQLFIGLFNGLAMALLFGRYISMEHFSQTISHIKHKQLFTWGTIYILPLYALTQALFGSFEIDAFGEPEWFQNYVFLFCLIGKIFFLYFTWRFMRDRLMHYFLHIMLAKYGIPNEFDKCFDSDHSGASTDGTDDDAKESDASEQS